MRRVDDTYIDNRILEGARELAGGSLRADRNTESLRDAIARERSKIVALALLVSRQPGVLYHRDYVVRTFRSLKQYDTGQRLQYSLPKP